MSLQLNHSRLVEVDLRCPVAVSIGYDIRCQFSNTQFEASSSALMVMLSFFLFGGQGVVPGFSSNLWLLCSSPCDLWDLIAWGPRGVCRSVCEFVLNVDYGIF